MSEGILKLWPDSKRVRLKAGCSVGCYHPERMEWWVHYYKTSALYNCWGCDSHCGRAGTDIFEDMPEQMELGL